MPLLVGQDRWPPLGSRRLGDLIELAILEEEPLAGLDSGFEHAPQLFCGLVDALNRLFDVSFDLGKAVGADHLSDGLFGLEELIYVSLGKTD